MSWALYSALADVYMIHTDEYKKGNLMQTFSQILQQTEKMLIQNSLYLTLNFIGIMLSTYQGKSENYNMHSHTNILGTQHLLLLVRLTHQSMPIVITPSIELRVPVPTVETIQVVLLPRNDTFTVMVHNLD